MVLILVTVLNVFEELFYLSYGLLTGDHHGHNPSWGDIMIVGISTAVK